MTATKEDQIRADFRNMCIEFESDNDTQPTKFEVYKACAESYEKKLAEKDVAMHHLVTAYQVAEQKLSEANAIISSFEKRENIWLETERKLDEANARNAMLVKALKNTASREDGDKLPCWCSDMKTGLFKVPHDSYCLDARDAITANSEAVAAWEAEKLEPLRMEVAAAQLHIKELRECLLYVKEQEPYSGLLDPKVINAALAKQPDTLEEV